MADTAISTNNKTNDDLSLTGKPVLVQNHLGIFYGFLEKSDSRSGSALLRDGFKLSPDRHITFSQYLDYLSNEMDIQYVDANDKYMKALAEAEDAGENPGEIGFFEAIDDFSITPNEILVSQDVFDEHRRELSITEYASEGVYLVQYRTSTHENSRHVQSNTPLISLTNISAIVAISEEPAEHAGLAYVAEDISRDGWLSHEEVIPLYYDVVSPLASFGIMSDRKLIEISQILTSIDDGRDIDPEILEKVNKISDEFFYSIGSKSARHIMGVVTNQVKSYINEDLIKDEKDLRKYILRYLTAIQKMPALVVNSDRRSAMYKKLKKAQDNEQDK